MVPGNKLLHHNHVLSYLLLLYYHYEGNLLLLVNIHLIHFSPLNSGDNPCSQVFSWFIRMNILHASFVRQFAQNIIASNAPPLMMPLGSHINSLLIIVASNAPPPLMLHPWLPCQSTVNLQKLSFATVSLEKKSKLIKIEENAVTYKIEKLHMRENTQLFSNW